ncbi:Hypothetical protein SRAE_X000213100 [Strongyloides ratti]|uniref:Protein YIPF n=1 Tax=Strongyloides ratti TaxID=34506 RepID=A0A090MQE8_STRRB|nr:Hypothetical protein SRAE_X000213100 [Strongyloides ratti]CEF60393.1 Hypothetical protein SRAE_X000213100 [Strongyloides ratti]
MDNNTTLNFLNFNDPPSNDILTSNISGNSRNTNIPSSQNNGFNIDDKGKKTTYLDAIQNYFNIDTNMFLNRLYCSVFPFKKSNFIVDVIENSPDIYGPLWILLTLVLCIGVTNSLVHFFNSYGEQSAEVDFGMVSAVFTLFSIYNSASINYTYMEILCTYGYNLTILVPISILYHFNFSFWRISLIIISVVITFTILYGTFWPALKNFEKKNEALIVMALILILQFAVITLLKVYYLDTLSPIKIPNDNSQINQIF